MASKKNKTRKATKAQHMHTYTHTHHAHSSNIVAAAIIVALVLFFRCMRKTKIVRVSAVTLLCVPFAVCVCVCKRVATFRLFLWIGMLNVVQGEWKVLLSGNVKKNLDLTRVFAYV